MECYGKRLFILGVYISYIYVLYFYKTRLHLTLIYYRLISTLELMRHLNFTFAHSCNFYFFIKYFEILWWEKKFEMHRISLTLTGAKFITLKTVMMNKRAFYIHWMQQNSMQFVKWNPISLSLFSDTLSIFQHHIWYIAKREKLQCDWSCKHYASLCVCVSHKELKTKKTSPTK